MFKRLKVPALFATILATLAIVAGGCGSSSGDGATQKTHRADAGTQRTAPPDGDAARPAAFPANADQVCDEINGKLAQLPKSTNDTFLTVSGRAVAIVGDGVERLRAIEPPARMRRGYGRFVKLVDEQNDLLEQARRAWQARDAIRVSAAGAERDRINVEQDALALELGLRACAASAGDRSRGGRSRS